MDREQVIKGLECCSDVNGKHCYEGKCPYASMSEPCREQLAQDAIILLKEQETVVRCKDCIHATMTADGKMCKYCEMDTDDCGDQRVVYHDADWFCADGERK